MSRFQQISNIACFLFAIVCLALASAASNAQTLVHFEDLDIEIPKDVGYAVDHSAFSPTDQLLFVVPPHYFKLFKPYPKDLPVTVMLMVNKADLPYTRRTDPAEVDHFNNFYIKNNLPHHEDGEYEVYETSKLDNIYISKTEEYPHTFSCRILFSSEEKNRYVCDVVDNLYGKNLFHGRSYFIYYQIAGREVSLSKAISSEIKQFLFGMIKTDAGNALTPNIGKSAQ